MMQNYWVPLLGGAIIGLAISILLFVNGRVAGVSGIVSGALRPRAGDWAWRLAFIAGLIAGGFALRTIYPESLTNTLEMTYPKIIIAGLLVGFGTVLGSGCTSGHGICGMSRLAPRSIIATIVFMAFGILAATVMK